MTKEKLLCSKNVIYLFIYSVVEEYVKKNRKQLLSFIFDITYGGKYFQVVVVKSHLCKVTFKMIYNQ